MKVVAIIPARYASTRFPGKPLALIGGRPMIQHVHHRALSCPAVSEVYIATDDERIFQCVRRFGGRAIMTERAHPSGTDRIAEASRNLKLAPDDIIVNIQGDQPAFEPSVISDMVGPLLEDRLTPMSTLMYRIRERSEIDNPHHVKVVTDNEGFALYFSRAAIPFFRDSNCDGSYYKHLGFYAYRVDFLDQFTRWPVGRLESVEKLEQLRALERGFKIKVIETTFDSIEVDTPEDIARAEAFVAPRGD
jgi:3-deoxy-manno-octulosonate cytidylyltransferase (CMP-KDO synthetase)